MSLLWVIHPCMFIYIYLIFPNFFNLVIIKKKVITQSSGEDVRLLSGDAYVGLLQSFSLYKPHPFSQSSASMHSDLPSSSLHPMNRTIHTMTYLLHFFFH